MNPFIGEPTGPAIYLDDFQSFLNGGQAARAPAGGKWQLMKNCWGARRGELLHAGPDTGAPTLVFDPGVKGRHAVFIGAYSPGTMGLAAREIYGIWVRLSADPHWTFLAPERVKPCYQEIYFKSAELDGLRIEIANFDKNSSLDYLKLVPVRSPPFFAPRGKVIGLLDFADDADESKPARFEAGSAVRRHAEAGYNLIVWKAYAVRCEYHTKIGEQRTHSYADNEILGGNQPVDSIKPLTGVGRLLQQYDTMRQAADEARKVGVEIYGWARISNEFSKPNHQFSATTPFHKSHPEAIQRNRDGSPTPRLSFAYPDVRRHKIEILCEIASYGMHGVCVDVLRHPPMAAYDLPLVEEFLNKTGRDPRQMENDGEEEWLRFRCGAFTRFLREARAALDRQADRRYPLIVRTDDQLWRNLHIGCDVEQWINEKLVDGIIFGPHCGGAADYPEEMDLTPYIGMAQGRVKIYGQVWRYGSGNHAEMLAKNLYRQGVDGVAFYESNATVSRPSLRERIWRFGRPDCLRG
ncbi:MAG: hypothetical protein HY360_02675 [Verrucomicrobia bacterium]|nr:hypothetical protein [Verrucomicrobiota bacterium]